MASDWKWPAVTLLFQGKQIDDDKLVRDVEADTKNKEAKIYLSRKRDEEPTPVP